jgi:hypothetical protein
LELIEQWWLNNLIAGEIHGADFDATWGHEVPCDILRNSFYRFCRERNVRSRLPDEKRIGASLKKLGVAHKQVMRDRRRHYVYLVPGLTECRKEWENFIGQSVGWD